jgi:hypothetical protein
MSNGTPCDGPLTRPEQASPSLTRIDFENDQPGACNRIRVICCTLRLDTFKVTSFAQEAESLWTRMSPGYGLRLLFPRIRPPTRRVTLPEPGTGTFLR